MKIAILHHSIFRLANELLESAGVIGFANDFQIDDKNWVQLAPFGDYPHPGPMGKNGKRLVPNGCLQRFDSTAAEAMVNEFNAPLTRLKRTVLGERPWYVGHHDVDPIKYPDPKSYGWIKELANRADGLYGRVDWTPAGENLVETKAFKYFSPYWDVAETGEKTPEGRVIVMPKRLNSVAFTNQPNIPVMPLSNEAEAHLMSAQEDPAELLISKYILLGMILEKDRKEWTGYFNEDFQTAAWALANADLALDNAADRSEAARKGWVTRRANMGSKAAKMPKSAAKAAAKAVKTTRGKSNRVLKKAPGSNEELAIESKASAAGHLEKTADNKIVWRSQAGKGKGSTIARSGAYSIKQHGAGIYSLHHTKTEGVIYHGSKAAVYKAAESHNLARGDTPAFTELARKSTGSGPQAKAALAHLLPPPLPKIGTPERAALHSASIPSPLVSRAAKAAHVASGHQSLRLTTAREDHPAFMQ